MKPRAHSEAHTPFILTVPAEHVKLKPEREQLEARGSAQTSEEGSTS